MLKTKNIIISVIFLFMFLNSFVSAETGLTIIENNINTTKLYQSSETFDITVRNDQDFTFYNVTFENSNIIDVPKFDILSGENKTVTVNIISDENFNGGISLRGDYKSDNIGVSNLTYDIDVNYDTGFSICNLDLIKGDTIIWHNTYSSSLKLINYETNNEINEIATISPGNDYTKQFNSPIVLKIRGTFLGFFVTPVCTINIINDNGYVHQLKYDAILNLSLSIAYEPTTVIANIPTTFYNIDYNKQKDDIFTIKNTGSKIAKNIKINAEWFNFTKNNFDLQPGESTNIGYTIKPQIFSTNETNITYTNQLTVKGNFDDIVQDFNIEIPYSQIVNIIGNSTVNQEVINEFFKQWCNENFDLCQQVICAIQPEQCSNGVITGGIQQFDFSKDTLAQVIEKLGKNEEEKTNIIKNFQEIALNSSQNDKEQNNEIKTLSDKITQLIEDKDESRKFSKFIILFSLFIVVLFLSVLYFFNDGFKDYVNKRFKFHKREESW